MTTALTTPAALPGTDSTNLQLLLRWQLEHWLGWLHLTNGLLCLPLMPALPDRCRPLTILLTLALTLGTMFAASSASLRQDRAAIEAALTLAWSSGQTEGQVTRLKLLKRARYGRATVDLLRQRVLDRAA